MVNSSAVAFAGGMMEWSNVTYVVGERDVYYQFYANDTSNQWNTTGIIFLNIQTDSEIMYDIAIVLTSGLISLGLCWFGISFKSEEDSLIYALKPMFFFVGYGLLVATSALMRSTAVTGGASSNTLDGIDTMAFVLTWTFVGAISIYMIDFLYGILKGFANTRFNKRWANRSFVRQ
jgi:hypothetical protein